MRCYGITYDVASLQHLQLLFSIIAFTQSLSRTVLELHVPAACTLALMG